MKKQNHGAEQIYPCASSESLEWLCITAMFCLIRAHAICLYRCILFITVQLKPDNAAVSFS